MGQHHDPTGGPPICYSSMCISNRASAGATISRKDSTGNHSLTIQHLYIKKLSGRTPSLQSFVNLVQNPPDRIPIG